jgi:tetratricopeptide (TPR) repeat protein
MEGKNTCSTSLRQSADKGPVGAIRTRAGDLDALYGRAETAASAEERASCLRDIEAALGARRRARRAGTSFDVPDEGAFQPVAHQGGPSGRRLAAMSLFEEAGEPDRALEAASLGAGFASRLGEISLAAELAAMCIPGMGSLDDSLVAEVANRLGIFCYSFLDYDRAIEQFEVALAAAERAGDSLEDLPPAAQHRRCPVAGGPPGPGVRRRGRSLRPFRGGQAGRSRARADPLLEECPLR